MPRILSSDMLRAMNAQHTGEAILVLIDIDHADLADALRVSSDAVNTVSNGQTYVSYPFRIILPDEPAGGRSPRANLQIDNVEHDILDTLRGISGPPSFDLKVVRGSAPDGIEARWPAFRLVEARYDALYITGELSLDDVLQAEYPAEDYLPIWFPGLF